MKRWLMEILACPICKFHPLELRVFEEKEEVQEGLITCPECGRWYPVIEEIPHMLPDELRTPKEDLEFMKKWKNKIPCQINRLPISMTMYEIRSWQFRESYKTVPVRETYKVRVLYIIGEPHS